MQARTMLGHQLAGIFQIEVARTLRGGRTLFACLLAALPITLFAARLVLPAHPHFLQNAGEITGLFAILFQTFFLRLLIFFGCVALFMGSFRSEIAEKTLHYFLLCPIRREALVAGKFLSGTVAATAIFGSSVGLSYLLIFASPPGLLESYVLNGPGKWHLLAYLLVTAMACAGYGALFLTLGLFFRNPIIPAAVVLGWESINFLLPSFLKKISIVYYLDSLCPVPISQGPIAILSEPAPFWIAAPGLLAVTVVLLVIASLRLRSGRVEL